MKTIQIPKAKHKAGMKMFQQNRESQVPQINANLRVLDFNDREIDAFWQSNAETRIFLAKFNEDQRFIHSYNHCIHEDSYPFVFEG